MTFTRTMRSILLLIPVVLLLVGCGGASKADYEKDMDGIAQDVSTELDAFDAGTPSSAEMTSAAKAMDDAAKRFNDVTPPSEVKDLHADLVDGVRSLASVLKKMAPVLGAASKDPSKISKPEMKIMNEASDEAQAALEKLEAVQEGYKKKDYNIGFEKGAGSADEPAKKPKK